MFDHFLNRRLGIARESNDSFFATRQQPWLVASNLLVATKADAVPKPGAAGGQSRATCDGARRRKISPFQDRAEVRERRPTTIEAPRRTIAVERRNWKLN